MQLAISGEVGRMGELVTKICWPTLMVLVCLRTTSDRTLQRRKTRRHVQYRILIFSLFATLKQL